MGILVVLRWLVLAWTVALGAGAQPSPEMAREAFLAPPEMAREASVPPPPVRFQAEAEVSNQSELRLDASLIEDFLRVSYFATEGRYHFREYSTCSYEFLQNPAVIIDEGVLSISADYYSRRGTEALGGCVGGPGVDTKVHMSSRLTARGSAVAIEVFEVRTDTLPELTSVILGLAGVELPMTEEFDLMVAMNGMLQDQQPFGIAALEVHEVVVVPESVLVRLTMQLGIW